MHYQLRFQRLNPNPNMPKKKTFPANFMQNFNSPQRGTPVDDTRPTVKSLTSVKMATVKYNVLLKGRVIM